MEYGVTLVISPLLGQKPDLFSDHSADSSIDEGPSVRSTEEGNQRSDVIREIELSRDGLCELPYMTRLCS